VTIRQYNTGYSTNEEKEKEMKPARRATLVGLVAAVALILAACGPATTPEPTVTPTPTLDPDNPELTIRLTEFRFNPSEITLRVGQHVTFHVVNAGATDHEIMIGRNPLRDESGQLGDGFEHDFFEHTKPAVEGDAQVMGLEEGGMDMGDSGDGGMDMEATATPEGGMDMGGEGDHMEGEMMNGFMAMFEPQQEATITFDVTEDMLGTWTMGCFEVSQDQVHFDEGMAGLLTVLPASN
jgi:plastocyanin